MKRGWMVIVDIGLGLGLVMWNYARFTIEWDFNFNFIISWANLTYVDIDWLVCTHGIYAGFSFASAQRVLSASHWLYVCLRQAWKWNTWRIRDFWCLG
jgi:Ni/Fe-hydrogenase subunit HybB-like protein